MCQPTTTTRNSILPFLKIKGTFNDKLINYQHNCCIYLLQIKHLMRMRFNFCEDNDFLWIQSLRLKGVCVCVGGRSMSASAGCTLQPWEEMMRRSAGILSPPFTSTRSPATTCSALICIFSPSRITRACCKEKSLFKPGGVRGTKIIPAVV